MLMLEDALLAFGILISKAFATIVVMLLAVLITFLAIPQSRLASMFFVAILSAFGGGLLIQLFATDRSWSEAFTLAVAFGAGFGVYPMLMMFTKFYSLLSADDQLHQAIYTRVRKILLSKIDEKTQQYIPVEVKKEVTEVKVNQNSVDISKTTE